MQIFLNELSICDQATNNDHAAEILGQVILIANATESMRGSSPIKRRRDLKNKPLLKGKSIQEVVFGDLTKESKFATLIDLFIQTFMTGPFFNGDLATIPENHQLIDNKGQQTKTSCLAAALFSPSGGIVISASCDLYKVDAIGVVSSIKGAAQIRNFHDTITVSSHIWKYAPSPKHAIRKDKVINGKLHSRMDLTDVEAQRALSSGIMFKDVVYNKWNGKWYIFRHSLDVRYHGYPYNPKEDVLPNEVERLWEAVAQRDEGQIIFHDLAI